MHHHLPVLIDADNVSAKVIGGLLAEIANYGVASVRWIYGDWTRPDLEPWKQCLLKYSITPIQQFAYTTGKNATDEAMIINAMDLLYTKAGVEKIPVVPQQDVLRSGEPSDGTKKHKLVLPWSANVHAEEISTALPMLPKQTQRPLDEAATAALRLAIINATTDPSGWVNLVHVGGYLNRVSPDMQPRNYGYRKLRELVEASGVAELEQRQMGTNPPFVVAHLLDD
ncbi:hypothetical protein EK21DRAFT_100928 [Setomelanomma holmii]|uniref:HTH OST-type domain-containing protein n=1 Tax=Setomelanomma holmii TaxID=210430 RepID=A0A9P4H843_9PLEO|nr:hypothetical protein EK21DRAFT_100928 [Setomelanomma holmii]